MMDKLQVTRAQGVLEIGAGQGVLTEMLAARAREVVAVEVDPPLAAHLRERFAGRVRIVEHDILKLPLDSILAPPARVIGNLPYYITSPILLKLFEYAHLFEEIAVMVQLEVAERLVAKPHTRDYGLLSVTAQYYTRPELLFRIPPRAFRPPPKVDSALVRMRVAPREMPDAGRFFEFLRTCFHQKRKTLLNNLKGKYVVPDVPPKVRAEELALDELASLFRSAVQVR